MANAGSSKIEMVEGMKVLHVDMSEASRGPAHKMGPGGLVLGKEQLDTILASDAETVEYDGCNVTTGICDPRLELDPKMMLQQSSRVSQMQHHYAHWLIAVFFALSILMLLVWIYAPRQPHGMSKQQQGKRGKKQGKAQKTIRTPAEEKKDK